MDCKQCFILLQRQKVLGTLVVIYFFYSPWNLKVDCQDTERGARNYTPALNVWRVLL